MPGAVFINACHGTYVSFQPPSVRIVSNISIKDFPETNLALYAEDDLVVPEGIRSHFALIACSVK